MKFVSNGNVDWQTEDWFRIPVDSRNGRVVCETTLFLSINAIGVVSNYKESLCFVVYDGMSDGASSSLRPLAWRDSARWRKWWWMADLDVKILDKLYFTLDATTLVGISALGCGASCLFYIFPCNSSSSSVSDDSKDEAFFSYRQPRTQRTYPM